MKRTRTAVVLLSGLLAISAPALAACGGVTEQAVEKAAEAAVGGDVDISDGNVTVTDEDGKSVTVGQNVDLPDGWPSEVPAFDGGSLSAAAVEPDGTASGMWMVDQTPADAVAAYGALLESAGFTAKESDSSMPSMDMLAGADYEGHGYSVNVAGIGADGKTMLTVSATKAL